MSRCFLACLAFAWLAGGGIAQEEVFPAFEFNETWTASGLNGWLSDSAELTITNISSYMDVRFAQQLQAMPESGYIGVDFPGVARITNISFKLRALGWPPGALDISLKSFTGRQWYHSLSVPTNNEWQTYNIPIRYTDGWTCGSAEEGDVFLFEYDMYGTVRFRFYIRRNTMPDAQTYSVDDVSISGYLPKVSISGSTVSPNNARTVVIASQDPARTFQGEQRQVLSGSTNFIFTNLDALCTWYVRAFEDLNSNDVFDATEAWAEWSPGNRPVLDSVYWLTLKLSTPPAIDNHTGATNLLSSVATLQGNLGYCGEYPEAVTRIYWGSGDGGTNAASWQNVLRTGGRPVGPFAATVRGLSHTSTYYYRCWASNAAGTAWAPTTASFVTSSNHPPAWMCEPTTNLSAGQVLRYTACASDTDNDRLSFSALSLPAWLTLQTNAAYLVKTAAGTGISGASGDGGAATNATLAWPGNMAVDAGDNIYIADTTNHLIRKVCASNGVIVTLAGTGAAGFSGDGGAGTNAMLNSPAGVAADAHGNVYVADTGNHRIRRIDAASGFISTIAGTGLAGYGGDSGVATNAQLQAPTDVAVDFFGNVYLADSGNHRIRKVNALTGLIATIAGTGVAGYGGDDMAATGATLDTPQGVALDGDGNLFIADTGNHVIRKIDVVSGVIVTIAGSGIAGFRGDGARAPSAQLCWPSDVAVSAGGDVYVADSANHRIRLVSEETGLITTFAGSGVAGYGGDDYAATNAVLSRPSGVTIDRAGNICVADSGNHRIRRFQRGAILVGSPSVSDLGANTVRLQVTDGATNVSQAFTVSVGGNAYTVSAMAGANGAIVPEGEVWVTYGGYADFSMQPNPGYHVTDVRVDGVSVGALSSYTLSEVTDYHSISVTFAINTYPLSLGAMVNGTVVPAGSSEVNHGDSRVCNIVPDVGYHVTDVLVDGVSVGAVSSYTFVNVTEAHTISATFALNSYTITASADANGSITPAGTTNLYHGSSFSYAIVPAANYYIAAVRVDGEDVGTPTNYLFANVSTSHTISATFAANVYTINAVSGSHGSISPDGVANIALGADRVYAIRPDFGYHVEDVTVDGVSQGAITNYSFLNVSASHTISATFAINVYTITASAGPNGSITPAGPTNVVHGSTVSYTIRPATGYHLGTVAVDSISQGSISNYTFTAVSGSHLITALFVINTYTITATAGANGSITPAGISDVNYGDTVQYSIVPDTGYHVVDVLADGVSVGAVTSHVFTGVSAGHSLSATFALNSYSVVASASAHGTITPVGTTNLGHGANITYSLVPDAHSRIADVRVDGVSVGTPTNYVFSSLSASHTISALFVLETNLIFAAAGINGSIVPGGMVFVDYNASTNFRIVPDPGYHSVSTVVDGVNIGPTSEYSFVSVVGPHTIAAFFADTPVVQPNTFEAWALIYFSGPQLAEPSISGLDADPDHDGMANWAEFIMDRSPLVSNALPEIGRLEVDPGRSHRFSLAPLSTARVYDVWFATNLTELVPWRLTFWTNIAGTSSNRVLGGTNSSDRIYYRVKVRLP